MKIGIIDADLLGRGCRYPNLALMKLSAYHKQRGHSVELILRSTGAEKRTGPWTEQDLTSSIARFDHIVVSKVFSDTWFPNKMLTMKKVRHGGTGFFNDKAPFLPDKIEHHAPDYMLYLPYMRAEQARGMKSSFRFFTECSVGFTTRGCFRRCKFCVNRNWTRVVRWSPLEEFLQVDKPYVILLDDNVLGFKGWREIFIELKSTGKRFAFRQGLDIRLLKEETAEVLNASRYWGNIYFACDLRKSILVVERKLKIWRSISRKATVVFLLSAYESQDEHDIAFLFERILMCFRYNCQPFVSKHILWKNSPYHKMYMAMSMWTTVRMGYFYKQSFRQFCMMKGMNKKRRKNYMMGGYQYDHKKYLRDGGTKGPTWTTMETFERSHPDIAKRYYDVCAEDVRSV